MPDNIAQDLYQSIRPLFPFFVTAIFVVALYMIAHRALIELLREFGREWRAFAEMRPSVRSINFGGLIGAFFLIFLEIWKNPFSMIVPEQYRAEAPGYYSDGIACFLIMFFVAFTLLCVNVSKNSRR